MKIGILGGIGPEITGYFYSEIITRLKKSGYISSNKDYPQIIINSINAPELTSLHVDDTMLEKYITGIQELALHKPDFIVMACNTIHVFLDILRSKGEYSNILSLREVVSKSLPQETAICVLGTPTTIQSGLYHFDSHIYNNPRLSEMESIGQVVNSYNATGNVDQNIKTLDSIISQKKKEGVVTYIAACTEISELMHYYNDESIEVIDTIELLIDTVIQKIKSES